MLVATHVYVILDQKIHLTETRVALRHSCDSLKETELSHRPEERERIYSLSVSYAWKLECFQSFGGET